MEEQIWDAPKKSKWDACPQKVDPSTLKVILIFILDKNHLFLKRVLRQKLDAPFEVADEATNSLY